MSVQEEVLRPLLGGRQTSFRSYRVSPEDRRKMKFSNILRGGGKTGLIITQAQLDRSPAYKPFFPTLDRFINIYTMKGKAHLGASYLVLLILIGNSFIYQKYKKPALLEEAAQEKAKQDQFERNYARWEANGRRFDYEYVLKM